MPNKKKKAWNPKYCIACHDIIKPNQKQATYTTGKQSVFYFHEEHFNALLGRTVGGRLNMWKITALVSDVRRKMEEFMLKKHWNNQDLETFNGMKEILATLTPVVVGIPIKPTNRPPKAHVEEFEPSQDAKDYDLMKIIVCLEQNENGLSSKQIEELTNIPRSTVTWRLWEQCEGNDKSKKEELFYIVQRVKGVQYYGLIAERIKQKGAEPK